MTQTFSLAPNPKWYFVTFTGLPAGGGSLYSFSSLNPQVPKFIFQDAAGQLPYPNPILIDANGTLGPLYFEFDPTMPDDLYFLEVKDAQGNLLWDINDFSPGTAGGGGNITTVNNIENLVINNVFWRNIGSTPNPITALNTTLSPGCHAGFAATASNAGPDIIFLKNTAVNTDQITFTNFSRGTTPLFPDVTPVQYLNYACTTSNPGETKKCIQIPIISNVQNLINQPASLSMWARANSGSNTLTLQWRTFYGDGTGATPDLITPIQVITLTSSWQKFTINSNNIPNILGSTPGGCGNSGLFLQIQYPLNTACNIDLTKPSIFLGATVPLTDFLLYDDIDGKLNVPRTGSVRPNYDVIAPLGWVLLNDGTIGNASSNATTRANIDTFPLFNIIWNNTNAQLFNSAGTPISRGASSIADFDANNQLSLPKQLGRTIASYGSGAGLQTYILGETRGKEAQIASDLPAHTHAAPASGNFVTNEAAAGVYAAGTQGTIHNATGLNATSGNPVSNLQPTVFANFIIKL